MMINDIKVKKIINELFCYGVRDIVKSYLFVKCKLCNTETLESNSYESYDDKHYCLDCRTENYRYIKKCNLCFKCYDVRIKHHIRKCPLCVFSCYIYCEKCCVFKYDKSIDGVVNNNDIVGGDVEHLNYYWLGSDYEFRMEVYNSYLNILDNI